MKFLLLLRPVILLFLSGFLASCSAYRILFLAPFPVPSHWMWLEHFVQEMLHRGHQVTALTNFATKSPHANYTELIIDPPYDLYPVSRPEWIYEGLYYSDWENLQLLWRVGLPTTKHAFESAAGQKLLHDPQLQFDLVISEQFFQESMLMFGHKFNAPIVTISTYDKTEYLDLSKGFRPSLGSVPHILLPYTESMTFWQRVNNLYISTLDQLIRTLYYMPVQNGMARHFFNKEHKSGSLPSVQEMEKRIAVTLFNGHPAMTQVRPSMPSHIHVGGVHLKPEVSSKLSENVRSFLDSAEEGVIYISFGSHVQSSLLPQKVIESIIRNIEKLPNKVLWKYEKDELKDKPDNVMLVKWLPQTEVLSHPNVVLFINHGGVFGTQESTYFGVPMLTIPFYGDQFRNAKNVERNGHGLMLSYMEITDESFGEKLKELLYNDKYRIKADSVARMFRDNPMKPMDVAMYWIEFVARHGGAPLLQSKAVDEPIWEYYNWDIYAAFVVTFFALTLVAFVLLRKLVGKKKKEAEKVKRN